MNLVEVFKALANNKRLQIIKLLKNPEIHFSKESGQIKNGGVCIKSIEQKIGISQSTVSHYINILNKADLIILERHGQWTYCKFNSAAFEQLSKMINTLK